MNRFDAWLRTAPAGSQFVYRRGPDLSKDGEGKEFTDLVFSAREAWDRGEVELVCRRLTYPRTRTGTGTFEWIAVKREKQAVREPWISKEGDIVRWVERPVLARAA